MVGAPAAPLVQKWQAHGRPSCFGLRPLPWFADHAFLAADSRDTSERPSGGSPFRDSSLKDIVGDGAPIWLSDGMAFRTQAGINILRMDIAESTGAAAEACKRAASLQDVRGKTGCWREDGCESRFPSSWHSMARVGSGDRRGPGVPPRTPRDVWGDVASWAQRHGEAGERRALVADRVRSTTAAPYAASCVCAKQQCVRARALRYRRRAVAPCVSTCVCPLLSCVCRVV